MPRQDVTSHERKGVAFPWLEEEPDMYLTCAVSVLLCNADIDKYRIFGNGVIYQVIFRYKATAQTRQQCISMMMGKVRSKNMKFIIVALFT